MLTSAAHTEEDAAETPDAAEQVIKSWPTASSMGPAAGSSWF